MLAALLACVPPPPKPGDPCGGCPVGELCDGPTAQCVPDLPMRCGGGTQWHPGQRAFEEASEAWGLVPGVAEGVRLATADLDGDGRPDLVVRRAGTHRDRPDARAVWVLRNTGHGFEDVTEASGLLTPRDGGDGRPAEVVIFADVDGDGDLDAYSGASDAAPETPEILLNRGDGTFELGPEQNEIRRPGLLTAIGGASFVDVNRDGHVDLWIGGAAAAGAPQQDRLYLGQGDGRFLEVTDLYGLTTEPWRDVTALNEARGHTISWAVAACDLNGDGRPELLSASYGRAPNHLWQAQLGEDLSVRFVNRSVESGYAYDGRMDWTDNESARCWCTLHPADEDCAGVPPPRYIRCQSDEDAFRWDHAYDREPFRLGGNSGTTVCGDVNNDGWLDLLTTEIVHWDVGSSSDTSELLINTRAPDLRFERPGNEATGLLRAHEIPWDDGDMTGALFDFDGDGRLDVLIASADYPGTRAHLYHQRPAGDFEEVADAEGIDHKSAHGVAIADFDGDGDLDVVLGHSRVRCSSGDHCYPSGHARLYLNRAADGANVVLVELHATEGTNTAAIGARVVLEAGDLVQVREVDGGHGHYGIQHLRPLYFGLGAACEGRLTVTWPDASGSTQEIPVRAGYRYRLVQGRPGFEAVPIGT